MNKGAFHHVMSSIKSLAKIADAPHRRTSETLKIRELLSANDEQFLYTLAIFGLHSRSEAEIHAKILSIDVNSPGHNVSVFATNELAGKLSQSSKELSRLYPSTTISIYAVDGVEALSNYDRTASVYLAGLKYLILTKNKAVILIGDKTLISSDFYPMYHVLKFSDFINFGEGREECLYFSASNASKAFVYSLDATTLYRMLQAKGINQNVDYARNLAESMRVVKRPYAVAERSSKKYVSALEDIAEQSRSSRIVILAPRPDLPYKSNGAVGDADAIFARQSDPVRVYWYLFPKMLELAYKTKGHTVRRIVLPNWAISQEVVQNLEAERIFVPHRDKMDISDGRVLFYMQEVLPNYFTVDPDGWAAGSRKYHTAVKELDGAIDKRINSIVVNLKKTKATKFKQSGKRRVSASDDYVFLPLQLPHDEVIKRHCDLTYPEYVNAICEWAERTQRKLIIKKHPFGEKIDYIHEKYRKSDNIQIFSDGHVHDYIKFAKVVMLVNSGVGFETLVYGKPLITFGRSMYDAVSIHCQPIFEDIEAAYQATFEEHRRRRQHRYYDFLKWYFSVTGTFLDRKVRKLVIGDETVDFVDGKTFAQYADLMIDPDVASMSLNERLILGDRLDVPADWPSLVY